MPLSTLIENNNVSMDVNFIEETLILGRILVIPLIIMVIPTTILMEIIIILRLILNLISKNLLLRKRISML